MIDPKEIAKRIRDKVTDLNDELILAVAAEVDVEFIIDQKINGNAVHLTVWCSQEVR